MAFYLVCIAVGFIAAAVVSSIARGIAAVVEFIEG